MYQPREYRHWVKGNKLVSFNVIVEETDLYIRASSDLSEIARGFTIECRSQIESYISQNPSFASSLKPLPVAKGAPPIVIEMAYTSRKFGIGPMASVAGAISRFVGSRLLKHTPEVIVENGGDIFINSLKSRVVAIYAGNSPLSGKIGLELKGANNPLGICTSSGTVGHSLSFGKADAVVVIAESATLADAAATAIGNIIIKPEDIPSGIELARKYSDIIGVVIIKDNRLGVWGGIKICRLSGSGHNLDTVTSPNL